MAEEYPILFKILQKDQYDQKRLLSNIKGRKINSGRTMEKIESQGNGSFSLLKECKKCGHTMLDHSTRSGSGAEPEIGSCKECDCEEFAE